MFLLEMNKTTAVSKTLYIGFRTFLNIYNFYSYISVKLPLAPQVTDCFLCRSNVRHNRIAFIVMSIINHHAHNLTHRSTNIIL